MESKDVYEQVNKRYGAITSSTTGLYEQTVAKAFGYTDEELAGIPEGANLGLSCGNPLALAKLREGETVIDLGSGAGFDVFTAAKRVGIMGKAIGVDMNTNMIEKANVNKEKSNVQNVQFVESAITTIPLPDDTADCIISNCVINLVPADEKQTVFNEIFRLLKPGGRVAVSDILARKLFTEEIKKNVALYVGCVAGASLVSDYDNFLRIAGFSDILIIDSKNDLNVYFTAANEDEAVIPVEGESCSRGESKQESCCEAISSACSCEGTQTSISREAKTMASQMGISDLNEWAGSFQIYAVKPLTNAS